MPKFEDVLRRLPDDKVGLQMLLPAVTNIRDTVRSGTSITFKTDAITTNDFARHKGKIAMIVWMDRDAYIETVNQMKQEESAPRVGSNADDKA